MSILRSLIFGLIVFSVANTFGQKSINNYKYVIVPEGYNFFKDNDQYQLNSLTKFLFNKYGFQAFVMGDEFPVEMSDNGCIALRADVKKDSGLFITKLIVELKDCNGVIVFTSSEGQSREKDYKKAYQEALRNAFKDVQGLNYKYIAKTQLNENASSSKDAKVSESIKPASINVNQEESKSIAKSEVGEKELYVYNGDEFILEKQGYGFQLFQNKEGQTVSIGKVFKTSRENNYIVNAGDFSGVGFFDSYGNFVLERINPVTDKLITDTFARQ